jgi:iron complex outermembrane recepter protein
LQQGNLGQDIPYLLSMTPSLVASSDAGTGVGYTSFRIRGTDMTRINVTVNGIPMNDSESHGVWWVNMPDFASSVDNIQIQRGVGTSTNGAAAFGATVNLQTIH